MVYTKEYSETLEEYSQNFQKNLSKGITLQHDCMLHQISEAVTQRCSIKKLLLKISQNLQENKLCSSLFFQKIAGLKTKVVIK